MTTCREQLARYSGGFACFALLACLALKADSATYFWLVITPFFIWLWASRLWGIALLGFLFGLSQ